ncbi:MAG TPA: S41 family peptidase [Micromonosporaceae bacterium]|nr:S41 family peptidase [Micromonosporaceae bacterium]
MTEVRTVVHRMNDWLGRLMPESERMRRLVASLEQRYGDRTDPVDAAACADIERAAWAHSRHLLVSYEPDGTDPPDTESRGWPDVDPAEVRRRAGSVGEVRRMPGGACVLRVDDLDPVGAALPYVDAAFALARDCTHLVLDLRANGGGDTATVAAIAGWLLGDTAIHLADATFADRVRQWWTPDRPPGTALPAELPVSVLTSAKTFSNGEALAYHLQARKRVRVVGERTPGAADYITPIRLAPTVLGLLPEATTTDPTTGSNWEGTGVVPDLECPAADALTAALGVPVVRNR